MLLEQKKNCSRNCSSRNQQTTATATTTITTLWTTATTGSTTTTQTNKIRKGKNPESYEKTVPHMLEQVPEKIESFIPSSVTRKVLAAP